MPQALALEGIFDAAVCKTAQQFCKYRKVFGGFWYWVCCPKRLRLRAFLTQRYVKLRSGFTNTARFFRWGLVLGCVICKGDGRTRIISVRRARQKEIEIYEQNI